MWQYQTRVGVEQEPSELADKILFCFVFRTKLKPIHLTQLIVSCVWARLIMGNE